VWKVIAKQTKNNRINKNMKNKWFTIGGVILAMAVTATVQAVPITGSIDMGGSMTLDTSTVNTATKVVTWGTPSPVQTGSASGSFGGIIPNTTVTMSPNWFFAPAPGTPLLALWSVGGLTFNFSSDTVSQGGGFLNISGFGTITSTTPGLDPTSFAWIFTANDPATGNPPVTFGFHASTITTPDGGTTAMLLGIALSGVALLKKKLTA
jgi:hypothetical protein